MACLEQSHDAGELRADQLLVAQQNAKRALLETWEAQLHRSLNRHHAAPAHGASVWGWSLGFGLGFRQPSPPCCPDDGRQFSD